MNRGKEVLNFYLTFVNWVGNEQSYFCNSFLLISRVVTAESRKKGAWACCFLYVDMQINEHLFWVGHKHRACVWIISPRPRQGFYSVFISVQVNTLVTLACACMHTSVPAGNRSSGDVSVCGFDKTSVSLQRFPSEVDQSYGYFFMAAYKLKLSSRKSFQERKLIWEAAVEPG